jgi:hypothetical protein
MPGESSILICLRCGQVFPPHRPLVLHRLGQKHEFCPSCNLPLSAPPSAAEVKAQQQEGHQEGPKEEDYSQVDEGEMFI